MKHVSTCFSEDNKVIPIRIKKKCFFMLFKWKRGKVDMAVINSKCVQKKKMLNYCHYFRAYNERTSNYRKKKST